MKIDSKEKYDQLQERRRQSRRRKKHTKLCFKRIIYSFNRKAEWCDKWHHLNDFVPVFDIGQGQRLNSKSRSVNLKEVFGGKIN